MDQDGQRPALGGALQARSLCRRQRCGTIPAGPVLGVPRGRAWRVETGMIPQQALAGLKVVEMGQLIAGPFAGKTLGDFGADVVKI